MKEAIEALLAALGFDEFNFLAVSGAARGNLDKWHIQRSPLSPTAALLVMN